MKKVSIITAGVLIGLTILYSSTRTKEVQVIKSQEHNVYAKTFLTDAADFINERGLAFTIDNQEISCSNYGIYVGSKAQIMFPLDAITELLNCSVNQYADGTVLIEKGSNTIKLYKNSPVALVNGVSFQLGDVVKEKEGITYVPIGNLAEALNYQYAFSFRQAYVDMSLLQAEETLPKEYDMRESDRVTAVRDQGRYGTCWAFAALGALETTLTPAEELTFSPDHMSLCNGFNLKQNEGGEYTMAIAYLASWTGPVLEEDDPYGDGETNEFLQSVKHLEEAVIIGEKDYEAIKEAVYKYGAVQTSIYTQLKNANSSSGYYNKERATYYFNGTATSNHDILIVGWDDTFPKEYFTNEPEGDGAFICKNSWGEDFGEDGYFYVSYYDNNIGVSNVAYTKLGDKTNFDNIYQSDLLGWTGQLGYEKEDAYFANVFEAGEGEELAAVSFYATDEDTSYEVYLVTNFQDKNDLNNRKLLTEGSFDQAGYYTVKLDEPVKLPDNEKFAVIVYIHTPNSVHPVAIEYYADARTATFDITDGEGYISLYGQVWSSAEETQNCNLCLKAFTNQREK